MQRVGRAPIQAITVKSFLRSFKLWPIWAFSSEWIVKGPGLWLTISCMAFGHELDSWRLFQSVPKELDQLGWKCQIVRRSGVDALTLSSIAQLNYIPIGAQAISLVSPLFFSWYSDYTGKRLRPLLVHSVGQDLWAKAHVRRSLSCLYPSSPLGQPVKGCTWPDTFSTLSERESEHGCSD